MHLCDDQFGFVKGKSTTYIYAIFALIQLQERYREGRQDLHCVFIDMEKNLRQSSEARTILVHARKGGVREVHPTGE